MMRNYKTGYCKGCGKIPINNAEEKFCPECELTSIERWKER